MNAVLPEFGRFVVVGIVCTVLQYLLLAAGVEWAGLAPVPASCAAFLASASVSYLANRRYTYASTAPHRRAGPRFLSVVAAGLLLNALFMQLLHGYLGLHYLPAQVLTTVVTMIWNYIAHRLWTFASAPVHSHEGR